MSEHYEDPSEFEIDDEDLEEFNPTDGEYNLEFIKAKFDRRKEDDRFNPGGKRCTFSFRFADEQDTEEKADEVRGQMVTLFTDITKGRNKQFKTACEALGLNPKTAVHEWTEAKGAVVRAVIGTRETPERTYVDVKSFVDDDEG